MVLIDPKIRQIIEPYLVLDESLLWVGKVDEGQRDAWLHAQFKSDQLAAPCFTALGVCMGYLSVTQQYQDNVLGVVFYVLLAVLFFWLAKITIERLFNQNKYNDLRPFRYYAITNNLVHYFDRDNKPLFQLDAKDLQRATTVKEWKWFKQWEPKYLLLTPVGQGLFKMSEIYFLTDFRTAEKDINKVISQRITP